MTEDFLAGEANFEDTELAKEEKPKKKKLRKKSKKRKSKKRKKKKIKKKPKEKKSYRIEKFEEEGGDSGESELMVEDDES